MKARYYIGIDPGRNTGFAVWDSKSKIFIELETIPFWRAADIVYDIHLFTHWVEVGDDLELLEDPIFVIEDPSQNRPTFYRPNATRREMEKISQNVGANKEHAHLLIERFESLGFEVLRVRPSKNTHTKLTTKAFKAITGYSGRTSEHARDAAMLVFGR